MRVLLFCPTQPLYPHVHPLTLKCIWAQQWDDEIDVMFGWQVDGDGTHPYVEIKDKYNRAREVVLSSGYDALYTIEADMIVPMDALQRLAAVDADVAYGLYCSRHNKRKRPDGYKWLAFQVAGKKTSLSWSNHPLEYIRDAVWGKVLRTQGVGLGCTLIHRRVLEQIEFRCHPTHRAANDWMLATDCQDKGFVQAHDFGLICGHILEDGERAVFPSVDTVEKHIIREIGE